MKKNQYHYYNVLLDKTKSEILQELGEGFNFYPDNLWTYDLKKTWWGRKTCLLLKFKDNNVEDFCVVFYYGKLGKFHQYSFK
nr:hypothetical protein [Elizabethkingia sp. ASV34]